MPMQPLAENTNAGLGDASLVEGANIKPEVPELGGPSGPEPTRYGDWERRGRCVDF
jgi:hypothetical protein